MSMTQPGDSPRSLRSVRCPHCQRTLEYSTDPPRFCSYCGQPLSPPSGVTTQPFHQADALADLSQLTCSLVGPRDAASEPLPERLGDYRLLRPLGAGGMGTVFEAEHLHSQRRVAIKLVSSRIATNPASLERFRREGLLASQISHPHCVFVLAAEEDAGRPYIVMELMPGQTLRDLVDERGPLPVLEAIQRTLELIEGLAEVHRLGVVHRDIKPSNCFVNHDGTVKLGDFGLSKSLLGDGHLTNTGAFLGTVLFAPPEQLRGERVDFTSDVYSVCATLYFLLTGKAPFDHEEASVAMARALTETPIPPRQLRPEVSPQLERIILRGLERDRSRRWQSLEELQRQLQALVPRRMTLSGSGARIVAYLLDELILRLALIPLLLAGWHALGLTSLTQDPDWLLWADELLFAAVALVYFTLGDGLCRGSLGKHWLALRVCQVGSTKPLGFWRGLIRTLCFLSASYGLSALAWAYASSQDWPLDEDGRTWLSLLAGLAGLTLLGLPILFGLGYRGLHDLLAGAGVVRLPWPRQGVQVSNRRGDDPLKPFDPVPADWPATLGGWRLLGVRRGADGRAVALAEDPGLVRRVLIWLTPDPNHHHDAAHPDTAPPTLAPLTGETAEINRATRLRCLGTGQIELGGQRLHWRAHVAPVGFPLAWASTPERPLNWATTRPILEQLSDELDAAVRDRTGPPSLCLEQVFVNTNTRLQLLDAPLDPAVWARAEQAGATSSTSGSNAGTPPPPHRSSTPPAHGQSARPALELLRQCAAVCLQGHAGVPGERIAAPVPRYAAAWLARLCGLRKPFTTVSQAREELTAYSGFPPQLSTRWRLTLLLIQSVLMLPATLLLLLIGLYLPLTTFSTQTRQQETARLLAMLPPHQPAQQLPAWTRAALSQPGFIDWLQREHATASERLRSQQALLTAGDRLMLDWLRQANEQLYPMASSIGTLPTNPLDESGKLLLNAYLDEYRATQSAGSEPPPSPSRWTVPLLLDALVLTVVLLWVWVFRGGVVYPLVGTALVQRDGRLARRWRCMLRAAAIWGVPVVLMGASVGCVEWGVPMGHAWCLAGVLGWLALLNLLALVWPERGLPDRLAGTFIVPR